MAGQLPLERRSALLARRIVSTRDALRAAIAPEGERPPFTEHLPSSEALAWWTAHRNDELGLRAVERMAPEQVVALDADLGRLLGQQGEGA